MSNVNVLPRTFYRSQTNDNNRISTHLAPGLISALS